MTRSSHDPHDPKDIGSRKESVDQDRNLWGLAILGLFFVLFGSVDSRAESAPGSQASSNTEEHASSAATLRGSSDSTKPSPVERRFSADIGFEYASSLNPVGSYEHATQSRLTFTPRLRLNQGYRLVGSSSLARDSSDEEQRTILSNFKLSLVRDGFQINETLKFVPSAHVTLPTNRFEYEDDFYRGSLGASGRIAFDVLKVSGAYGLSYDRRIHEFSRDVDGQANLRESLTNSLSVSLPLRRGFTATFSGAIVSAWTYQSSIVNQFELAQVLAYSMSEAMSVWVGHSNGGNAYKPNGAESNIALFDEYHSSIQAGGNFAF